MSDLHTDVLVVGAGAIGCAVAAQLADRGLEVVLAGGRDPQTASRVAAGMVAPLSETTLDPESRDAGPVLDAAAAAWPQFAARFGLSLRRCGGLVLRGPDDAAAAGREAPGESIALADARRMAPFLEVWEGDIRWLAGESAIDPAQALAALEARVLAGGGRRVAGPVDWDADGAWRAAGGRIRARRTVIAAGHASRGLPHGPAELAVLQPIRGQILQGAARLVPAMAPFVRGPGAYVAPQADGSAMIGATMDAGVGDLAASERDTRRLLSALSAFAPGLAAQPMTARVGIRATTPDALPLVGPSSSPGVLLATGLRRNGWLLAPLVAGMIADYLAGEDPGPQAQRLRPRRFERA